MKPDTPRQSQGALRLSLRLYRGLLRAYPAAFRAHYGDDMAQVFRDLCRDALRQSGLRGLSGLWLHTALDLAATALKERLLNRGYRSANQMDVTEFNSQLVNTLERFSQKLREGYNVLQCLEGIADEAPEPTASAFGSIVADIQNGRDPMESFEALTERLGSEPLQQVVETMKRQRVEGGNLADKLDALGESFHMN